MMGEGINRNM